MNGDRDPRLPRRRQQQKKEGIGTPYQRPFGAWEGIGTPYRRLSRRWNEQVRRAAVLAALETGATARSRRPRRGRVVIAKGGLSQEPSGGYQSPRSSGVVSSTFHSGHIISRWH